MTVWCGNWNASRRILRRRQDFFIRQRAPFHARNRREIAAEFREPSRELVRHFAKQVYSKTLTQGRWRNSPGLCARLCASMSMIRSAAACNPPCSRIRKRNARPKKRLRMSQIIRRRMGRPTSVFLLTGSRLKQTRSCTGFFMALHDWVLVVGDDVRVEPVKYAIFGERGSETWFTALYFRRTQGAHCLLELFRITRMCRCEEGLRDVNNHHQKVWRLRYATRMILKQPRPHDEAQLRRGLAERGG